MESTISNHTKFQFNFSYIRLISSIRFPFIYVYLLHILFLLRRRILLIALDISKQGLIYIVVKRWTEWTSVIVSILVYSSNF